MLEVKRLLYIVNCSLILHASIIAAVCHSISITAGSINICYKSVPITTITKNKLQPSSKRKFYTLWQVVCQIFTFLKIYRHSWYLNLLGVPNICSPCGAPWSLPSTSVCTRHNREGPACEKQHSKERQCFQNTNTFILMICLYHSNNSLQID